MLGEIASEEFGSARGTEAQERWYFLRSLRGEWPGKDWCRAANQFILAAAVPGSRPQSRQESRRATPSPPPPPPRAPESVTRAAAEVSARAPGGPAEAEAAAARAAEGSQAAQRSGTAAAPQLAEAAAAPAAATPARGAGGAGPRSEEAILAGVARQRQLLQAHLQRRREIRAAGGHTAGEQAAAGVTAAVPRDPPRAPPRPPEAPRYHPDEEEAAYQGGGGGWSWGVTIGDGADALRANAFGQGADDAEGEDGAEGDDGAEGVVEAEAPADQDDVDHPPARHLAGGLPFASAPPAGVRAYAGRGTDAPWRRTEPPRRGVPGGRGLRAGGATRGALVQPRPQGGGRGVGSVPGEALPGPDWTPPAGWAPQEAAAAPGVVTHPPPPGGGGVHAEDRGAFSTPRSRTGTSGPRPPDDHRGGFVSSLQGVGEEALVVATPAAGVSRGELLSFMEEVRSALAGHGAPDQSRAVRGISPAERVADAPPARALAGTHGASGGLPMGSAWAHFRAEVPSTWPRAWQELLPTAAADLRLALAVPPGGGRATLSATYSDSGHGFLYPPLKHEQLRDWVETACTTTGRSCPPTCATATAEAFLARLTECGASPIVAFAAAHKARMGADVRDAQAEHERQTALVQLRYAEAARAQAVADRVVGWGGALTVPDEVARQVGAWLKEALWRRESSAALTTAWELARVIFLALQLGASDRDSGFASLRQAADKALADAAKTAQEGKAVGVPREEVPPPPLVLRYCAKLKETFLSNDALGQANFARWVYDATGTLESNATTYAALASQCGEGRQMLQANRPQLIRGFLRRVPPELLYPPGRAPRGEPDLPERLAILLRGVVVEGTADYFQWPVETFARHLQTELTTRETQRQLLREPLADASQVPTVPAWRRPLGAGTAARPTAARAYAVETPRQEWGAGAEGADGATVAAAADGTLLGAGGDPPWPTYEQEELDAVEAAAYALEAEVLGVAPAPPPVGRPRAPLAVCGGCFSCTPQPCLVCRYLAGPTQREEVPSFLHPFCEEVARAQAAAAPRPWTTVAMAALLERLTRGGKGVDPQAAQAARQRRMWAERMAERGGGPRGNPPLAGAARQQGAPPHPAAFAVDAGDQRGAAWAVQTRGASARAREVAPTAQMPPDQAEVAPPRPPVAARVRATSPPALPRAPGQGLHRGARPPPFLVRPMEGGGDDDDLAVVRRLAPSGASPPLVRAASPRGTPAPSPSACTTQELLATAGRTITEAPEVGPAVQVHCWVFPADASGRGLAPAVAAAVSRTGLAAGVFVSATVDTAARIAVLGDRLEAALSAAFGTLIDPTRSRVVTVADSGRAARSLTVPLLLVFVEPATGRTAQFTIIGAVMPGAPYDLLLPTGVLAEAGAAIVDLAASTLVFRGGRHGLEDDGPVRVPLERGVAAALFVELDGDPSPTAFAVARTPADGPDPGSPHGVAPAANGAGAG